MHRITPLTIDQRAELDAMLANIRPAAPTLLFAAHGLATGAARYRATSPRLADRSAHRAADHMPAILRRLLTAEQQLDAIRATLTDALAAATLAGEDIDPYELLDALDRAGVPLTRDVIAAEEQQHHQAAAEARA